MVRGQRAGGEAAEAVAGVAASDVGGDAVGLLVMVLGKEGCFGRH